VARAVDGARFRTPTRIVRARILRSTGAQISKRDPETLVEPIEFAQRIADAAHCDFEIGVDACVIIVCEK
jgi:hypothetical protein